MTSPRTATLDASGAPEVLDRLIRSLLIVMVGVDALYLIVKLVAGDRLDPAVDEGLSLVSQAVPIAIVWIVSARIRFRKPFVVFAAAAVTATMSGDWIYRMAMDQNGYLAFPSPADAAFLLFYPLIAAAVVAYVGPQLRGVGGLVLLETAVAAVGASAVLAVILDPIIANAVVSGDPFASTVAIAYPAFDLFVLAIVAGIAAVPTISLGRHAWALIAGLGIFTAADIVWAFMAIEGTYLNGTPLDLTWLIAIGFLTWWVAGMATADGAPIRVPRRALPASLSVVAVLAGLAVLVVGTQTPLSLLAIVLATVTVGLSAVPVIFRQAVLRQTMAVQQEAVRHLTSLDQAKTDLMVTMNHEFRTPLTSITGHVELLLDGAAGELPESADRMLLTIERNAARLGALMEATLTSAQLEDDRNALARVPLPIADLVTEVVERRRLDADARGIQLDLVIVDDTLSVEADAAQLGRALANLLDNALKFTSGGGLVTVAVGPWSRTAMNVHIGDSGIGIPAEDIPQLFGRYFRASNVQNAAIPGVGLGLSIAHHIVRAHHGAIHVESIPQRGTTITVTLPLAAGAPRFGVRRAARR